MKDHEIRELVNQLRDIAVKYHAAGQLREQIARVIRSAMLQAGNCRENDNSSTKHFREITETSTSSPEHSGLRPEQSSGSPAPSPIDHGYRPGCVCSGCKATARICAELAGNSPVIPDGSKEALSGAVAAIYFTDSTDYLPALYSVVKALSPEVFAQLLSNDKAAFDATRLPVAPQEVK
ncbi:TPA: hypothetical protein QHD31_005774 [Raoultella ornithinolytica]|nr:hypothetical protein [Raoultella ornithinolytica]